MGAAGFTVASPCASSSKVPMLHTLFNWLKFDVQNLIVEVWWCVGALWCALLLISLIDVAGNSLRRGEKALWMVLILLLPCVGLAAYSIACLLRSDYYLVDFLFKKRTTSQAKANSISHPQ